MWLGGVATILVARISQLVIVPLSGVSELGLYVVAVTISDIPWIIVQAVRDVVFGSSAAERERRADARDVPRRHRDRRAQRARPGNAAAVARAVLRGGIHRRGGRHLGAAGESVVAVPGLVAGAAVAAAGRPGARSAAIVSGLVVDVAALVLLVPAHGALGAAVANLFCTATITGGCLAASRVLIGTPLSPLSGAHRGRRRAAARRRPARVAPGPRDG